MSQGPPSHKQEVSLVNYMFQRLNANVLSLQDGVLQINQPSLGTSEGSMLSCMQAEGWM